LVLAACGGSPRGSVQTFADASAADSGDVCPQVLPASCPAQVPSYRGEIASLVQQRCLGCHGPGGTAYPARDFTSYAKVYARRRNILGMVYGCTMPPAGATPLAPQERRDLLTWFVCNAPDN
jgi:mono/diheme cytochrome c family protein